MIDFWVRTTFVAAAATGALLTLVGGWLTPVFGVWLDGPRRIRLTQLGPVVLGKCERGGGHETYAGLACFGFVWLRRRDFGVDLIVSNGFEPGIARLVSGQVMAWLHFRLRDDELRGKFFGKRFTVSPDGRRVVSTARAASVERKWQRAGVEA